MIKTLPEKISEKFKELYKEEPLIIKSPGRVNLIGEHTDYNMGFVLPAAIDKAIYLAVTPRYDNKFKIYAFDLNDKFEFSTENFSWQKSQKNWPNYLMGVVEQFLKNGYDVKGLNCVFGGDIPIGAGLSSSAALEAGLGYSLNLIFNFGIERLKIVQMAQKAENEFVGVNCGIMDQYINIFGKPGNVLRIDCRSLENKFFPFEYGHIAIVLVDTRISHSLASSEYNQRRSECSIGVNLIKEDYPEVQSLRDITSGLLEEYKSRLDPVVYKRCNYVIHENERLLNACDALGKHELRAFGAFMYETHEGLSKNYEVSCPELDYLVELTKNNPRVYGSRMMGGGFGGCTINLIEKDAVDEFSKNIIKSYLEKFNKEPKVYVTSIDGGTRIYNLKENAADSIK